MNCSIVCLVALSLSLSPPRCLSERKQSVWDKLYWVNCLFIQMQGKTLCFVLSTRQFVLLFVL